MALYPKPTDSGDAFHDLEHAGLIFDRGALADAALHGRLSRVRAGYGFVSAGKYNLPGFEGPTELFQLLRFLVKRHAR